MAMILAPGVVKLLEKDVPEVRSNQVLIAIKTTGICGSDLHIYKGKHPYAPLPTTIGHEFSGEVKAIGNEVKGIQVGDRVTVEPTIVCGRCLPCLKGDYGFCDNIGYHYRKGQGALGQYFVSDERFVYKIPSHLSYDAGALIEPLAVAVHAVKRAHIGLGDKVLILGGGTIGILVAAVCEAAGATEIVLTDLMDYRLEKASSMGATKVLNPQKESVEDVANQITDKRGFAKIFECVGVEKTLLQAMNLLAKGGVVTAAGIFEQPQVTLNVALFVAKEITVQGTQAYCWDYQTALDLTKRIDLQKLITHTFPLSEIEKGFQNALDPAAKALKIVLHP
jgi:2-desacetyl-2-hydroxyethyl bacteriochlorophyllide A dehydrogenase